MKNLYTLLIAAILFTGSQAIYAGQSNPKVQLATNLGNIVIELYPKEAPITVKNFLDYVDNHFYDETIFHRVVPGFIIQGGGLDTDFNPRKTREPIKNESSNGLKNDYQMVAMANTDIQAKGSEKASSQFFINLQSNTALNTNGKNLGYTVFGKVIEGMEIAEKISMEPRGMFAQFPEAPNNPIKILKAERLSSNKIASGSKTTTTENFSGFSAEPMSN